MVKLTDIDDISDLIYNVPYVNNALILSDNSIIDYNHWLHILVEICRVKYLQENFFGARSS